MKILKVLALIIGVLILILVLGGLFLPKTYSVSRSTTINAPDSVIYKNIADFNEFYKWNAWAKMDTAAKTTITGPVAEPNHLYHWEGEKMGTGQMKILTVEPNKMVDIELKFIKPFESIADTRFVITPSGQSNQVTWYMNGECKGLMDKWSGFFMDKMIGKDFEDGLRFLKEKSEAGK